MQSSFLIEWGIPEKSRPSYIFYFLQYLYYDKPTFKERKNWRNKKRKKKRG